VRKNIGSRPDSEVEVAPSEIIGMPAVVTCLYVFLTTPLDGGPMITDGFLEISARLRRDFSLVTGQPVRYRIITDVLWTISR